MNLIDWPRLIAFTLYAVGLLGIVFFPQPGEDVFRG